ncbi:unnamed protein product [Lactuca saligna]|uniref:Uncharacterized protein n=1 Tax=Lactuca saligna TaxID=75948 RepID=A0AA35ZYC2_LACSI|nr:unnamed protein product [Lactuca saligna]
MLYIFCTSDFSRFKVLNDKGNYKVYTSRIHTQNSLYLDLKPIDNMSLDLLLRLYNLKLIPLNSFHLKVVLQKLETSFAATLRSPPVVGSKGDQDQRRRCFVLLGDCDRKEARSEGLVLLGDWVGCPLPLICFLTAINEERGRRGKMASVLVGQRAKA